MKFDEKPLIPGLINIHLFQKGKREVEKQREKCPKNAENFASKREEGKCETEIQIWIEATNTGIGEG